MAHELPLTGMRIVVFAGDVYEDLELWYPVLRMREAGAEVVLAATDKPRQDLFPEDAKLHLREPVANAAMNAKAE